MFVSGESWRLFKEAHPEQDFSDFWLEVSLKFSTGCFDIAEDNSRDPGHVVELSF
jgi:hypothetical protein